MEVQMMHQGVFTKTKVNSFFPVWVRQRELRQRLPLGHSDVFYKSLYSSISPCYSWDGGESSRREHGGLSCLEFSPDGSLLVAGCDKDSFLMFDPLSRKLIRTVHNTRDSVVTHVKFLDSRNFATGCGNGRVSLWDTRNLKSQFRTLLAHTYTIGNIEFSRKNDLLITSACDGFICIWDKKSWNLTREFCTKTVWSPILQRLRLNPDESKMIISTARGYLLIVHDLDLNTFALDLRDFELQTFGFVYFHETASTSRQNRRKFPSSNCRRNRVEIVADFPNAGGYNVISALEIHPQGWCAFSRCVSEESRKTWTCVHDIQERESSKGGSAPRGGSGDECPPCPQQDEAVGAKRRRHEMIKEDQCSASGDKGSAGSLGSASVGFCMPSGNDASSECSYAAFAQERRARKRGFGSPADTAQARSPPPGPSFAPPPPLELAGLGCNPASSRVVDLLLPHPSSSVTQFNRRDYEHSPRLTHYIEEPYSSYCYIESLSVSSDGRLVCSPLKRDIRLLAFSPECSEQSVSWCGTKPRRLFELSTHTSHGGSVLCTKFSPLHCLLVSGCSDGELTWYQPVV